MAKFAIRLFLLNSFYIKLLSSLTIDFGLLRFEITRVECYRFYNYYCCCCFNDDDNDRDDYIAIIIGMNCIFVDFIDVQTPANHSPT